MSSRTRQQLEAWLKTISVSAGTKVLDIGGSQKPVAGRIGSSIPIEGYRILDLEQPHEVHTKPHIVGDISGEYIELDKNLHFQFFFDVAFCLEVMEYVVDPIQTLENINSFLKKDGALFISTAFLYPVHNPYQEDKLRYTEAGITAMLQRTGFKVVEVVARTAEHNNLTEAFYSLEGMKPSREFEGHDHVGHLISAVKV